MDMSRVGRSQDTVCFTCPGGRQEAASASSLLGSELLYPQQEEGALSAEGFEVALPGWFLYNELLRKSFERQK